MPEFRVAELRNAVEKLEGDLCISRPAARLKWGIPFPESFGAGFVTYVWFDALVNYVTFVPGHDPKYAGNTTDKTEFQRWWPALHIIGKDIMIPAHGIYWPIMLKSLGYNDDEIPRLLVHGWWNVSGAKMSKSLGNVVDPDVLADTYGAETLRYYLMTDIATGYDADFNEERLIQRHNSELANSLGNLLNRTLNMTQRYRGGVLTPAGEEPSPLRAQAEGLLVNYRQKMDAGEIHAAFAGIGEFATACNAYIEMAAPWKLAKDPAAAGKLDHVLYGLAEALRITAILISPVLPQAARGIFEQLNWKAEPRLEDTGWGGLPDGHTVGKPTPLFPRIEPAAAADE